MTPSELSRDLREDQSPSMQRRRWIFGLSMAGVAIGKIVSLYQMGIIKHLPDPPLDILDSDKVDASDYAYKRLQTPDAVLMIFTYAATAWLASAGGAKRNKTAPALPILLGTKAISDVATNITLAREEWAENKKLCTYCQTAALLSIATVFLALPDTLRALGVVPDDEG